MEGEYGRDSRKTIRSGGKRDYDSDFILKRLVVRLWGITAIWMSINLFCEGKISPLSATQFLCLCSRSQKTCGLRGCSRGTVSGWGGLLLLALLLPVKNYSDAAP